MEKASAEFWGNEDGFNVAPLTEGGTYIDEIPLRGLGVAVLLQEVSEGMRVLRILGPDLGELRDLVLRVLVEDRMREPRPTHIAFITKEPDRGRTIADFKLWANQTCADFRKRVDALSQKYGGGRI